MNRAPLSLQLGASDILRYESSLVRLHKEAVPRKGPCPATRSGLWATCPLLIQQAVAAAAGQQMILVMCHREFYKIEMVQIGDFEPHTTWGKEFLQIGRS